MWFTLGSKAMLSDVAFQKLINRSILYALKVLVEVGERFVPHE